MEKQLQELKKNLSTEELADFVFTDLMKSNILGKIEASQRRKSVFLRFSNIVPISLSFAAILIFSVGIHSIVTSDVNTMNNPTPNPGRNTDTGYDSYLPGPKENFTKPVLLPPGYIPQGYVFKQTHIDGELYQHVYVSETNEQQSFYYGMLEESEPAKAEAEKEVQLTEDITGYLFQFSANTYSFFWKAEGVYQFVEQRGGMKESDFYKIIDSILQEKGYISLLGPYIAELEAQEVETEKEMQEKKAEETKNAKLPFDESKAIGLLNKYNEIMDSAFKDAQIHPEFKFMTYQTKEEFYALFTDFMSPSLVEAFFGNNLEEREDGLYNLPTETPPHYIPSVPYSFEKVNDTEYKLTQVIEENGIYYNQNIITTFKNTSGKWIIGKIEIYDRE